MPLAPDPPEIVELPLGNAVATGAEAAEFPHAYCEDVARLIYAVFRHADPGSYLLPRSFPEIGSGPPSIYPPLAISADGNCELLIAEIVKYAETAARNREVFCPPYATFKSPVSAKLENLANGLALVVDFDQPFTAIESLATLEAILGPATLVSTSGGAAYDALGIERHKLRAIWRLTEPTREDDEHALLQDAGELAALYVGTDRSAASPVHPHRFPGTWHQKGTPRLSRVIKCRPDAEIDLDEACAKLKEANEAVFGPSSRAPAKRAYTALAAQVPIEKIRRAMAFVPNDIGKNWEEFNRMGMALYRASGGSQEGLELFLEWSRKSELHNEDVSRDRWDHYAKSPPSRTGFGKVDRLAKRHGWLGDDLIEVKLSTAPKIKKEKEPPRLWLAEPPALVGLPDTLLVAAATRTTARPELTESGLAEGFVLKFGQICRYVFDQGCWLLFHGDVWRRDCSGIATLLMLNLCQTEARSGSVDYALGVRITKHAFVRAALEFAKIDRNIAISSAALDTHPMLMATPGGTVDLTTGILRAADPVDFLTQIAGVTPIENADCPIWLQFLAFAFGGDQELIEFLQSWLGYCLTGDITEQQLVFFWGLGGNGKGVILHVMAAIMASYHRAAAIETFISTPSTKHPTDIHFLRGARLVTVPETQRGRKWDETRIKQLTGGDEIASRGMNENFTAWIPQLKLTVSGNSKPAFENVDDAHRRRFNLVEFGFKPTVPDPLLEEKLKTELPAIFRWAINGCLAWKQHGLRPPQKVLEATSAYFAEMDTFGQWAAERVILEPEAKVQPSALLHSYNSWAKDNNEPIIGGRALKASWTVLQPSLRFITVRGVSLVQGAKLRPLGFHDGPGPTLPPPSPEKGDA